MRSTTRRQRHRHTHRAERAARAVGRAGWAFRGSADGRARRRHDLPREASPRPVPLARAGRCPGGRHVDRRTEHVRRRHHEWPSRITARSSSGWAPSPSPPRSAPTLRWWAAHSSISARRRRSRRPYWWPNPGRAGRRRCWSIPTPRRATAPSPTTGPRRTAGRSPYGTAEGGTESTTIHFVDGRHRQSGRRCAALCRRGHDAAGARLGCRWQGRDLRAPAVAGHGAAGALAVRCAALPPHAGHARERRHRRARQAALTDRRAPAHDFGARRACRGLHLLRRRQLREPLSAQRQDLAQGAWHRGEDEAASTARRAAPRGSASACSWAPTRMPRAAS